MTVAALFPSPAEVEANTPATRDRAIDVIRIVSLVGVVVGHTIMATSIIRDDVFIWSNLLTASVIFQALTWVFQIMPLFFFAGVAACVDTWHPGDQLGQLADAPLHPAVPAGVLLPGVLGFRAGDPALLPARARLRTRSPGSRSSCCGSSAPTCSCWPPFRCYARITTTGRLLAPVAGTYVFIAVIDAIRINGDGPRVGYLNLVAWLIPGMLGVAYRRHLLAGRAALHARRGDARRQPRADAGWAPTNSAWSASRPSS